jgi:hypothetical protein
MTRMIAALTAVSFVLGTAAYADTPSSAPSAPSSKILAYNGQGTVTNTVPVFSAANPGVPGATDRSIARGNKSTIARDAAATRMQQTGAFGGGN